MHAAFTLAIKRPSSKRCVQSAAISCSTSVLAMPRSSNTATAAYRWSLVGTYDSLNSLPSAARRIAVCVSAINIIQKRSYLSAPRSAHDNTVHSRVVQRVALAGNERRVGIRGIAKEQQGGERRLWIKETRQVPLRIKGIIRQGVLCIESVRSVRENSRGRLGIPGRGKRMRCVLWQRSKKLR